MFLKWLDCKKAFTSQAFFIILVCSKPFQKEPSFETWIYLTQSVHHKTTKWQNLSWHFSCHSMVCNWCVDFMSLHNWHLYLLLFIKFKCISPIFWYLFGKCFWNLVMRLSENLTCSLKFTVSCQVVLWTSRIFRPKQSS